MVANEKEEISSIDSFIQTLIDVQNSLSSLSESRSLREVFGWEAPPLSKGDLISELASIVDYIESHNIKVDETLQTKLQQWRQFLNAWTKDAMPHLYHSSYWRSVINGFIAFLFIVKSDLTSATSNIPVEDLQKDSKNARRRIDALNKRLMDMESDIDDLDASIKRIIEADNAAQQLPETLSSLRSADKEVSDISTRAKTSDEFIQKAYETAKDQIQYIKDRKSDIADILDRCNKALAYSTSVGLAKSFYKRKVELQLIGLAWTVALIGALVAAIIASYWRANQIFVLMEKGLFSDSNVVIVNLLISLALVGAPVWLAWLSTKQVGYYFRLSEDYGFKASVSASYEGFRREAEQQDPKLEKRILASTIDRYEEPPLRFVDGRVSGSPIHELIQSAEFRDALKRVPDFGKEVIGMAKDKLKQSEEMVETVKNVAETAVKKD